MPATLPVEFTHSKMKNREELQHDLGELLGHLQSDEARRVIVLKVATLVDRIALPPAYISMTLDFLEEHGCYSEASYVARKSGMDERASMAFENNLAAGCEDAERKFLRGADERKIGWLLVAAYNAGQKGKVKHAQRLYQRAADAYEKSGCTSLTLYDDLVKALPERAALYQKIEKNIEDLYKQRI